MTTAEKLTTIAENQQKVYDAGYEKGLGDYDNAFWNTYQKDGNRTNYAYGFSGAYWDDTTFTPKYDIAPQGNIAYILSDNRITDLKGILERLGITLDLSKGTSGSNLLMWSTITRLPVLDLSSMSEVGFYYAYKVKSVDKIILKKDGSQSMNFGGCSELTDVVFEGVIGKSVNFGVCPLSKASINSVLSALSTTSTGQTVTFKKTAKEASFTDAEWNNIKAAKSNWTIAVA